VPLLIIDELDRHKRNTQPIDGGKSGNKRETVASRARRTLRKLEDLVTDPAVPADLDTPSGGPVQLSLLMDDSGHQRLPDPDSEIIAKTQAASDVAGAAVVIVTHDTGMHLRARAAGLRTARPPRATPTTEMD
jgi:predicted ribonuclease YlaK